MYIKRGLTYESHYSSLDKIKIPKGTLDAFYWYEGEEGLRLLETEKRVMNRFLPQFTLKKLPDGKMVWFGSIVSNMGSEWELAAVYQNNHPDNSTYGGSIRVYPIEPDLNHFEKKLGILPHVLGEANDRYLCTSQANDFKSLKNQNGKLLEATSAASALAWAGKWILMFESWIYGEISLDDFASHGKY